MGCSSDKNTLIKDNDESNVNNSISINESNNAILYNKDRKSNNQKSKGKNPFLFFEHLIIEDKKKNNKRINKGDKVFLDLSALFYTPEELKDDYKYDNENDIDINDIKKDFQNDNDIKNIDNIINENNDIDNINDEGKNDIKRNNFRKLSKKIIVEHIINKKSTLLSKNNIDNDNNNKNKSDIENNISINSNQKDLI